LVLVKVSVSTKQPCNAPTMARALAILCLASGAAAFKAFLPRTTGSAVTLNSSSTGALSKDIADLEDTVHQLLREEATPSLSKFADDLNKIIEDDMKAAVLKVKASLQTELDGHYAGGYDTCDSSLATSTSVSAKSGLFTTAASQHSSCRKDESDAETAYSTCAKEEEGLKSAKEAACKVVSDLNSVSNGNCAKQSGETYVTYTARLMKFYEDENTKGIAAEKKCKDATEVYEAKSKSCSDLKSTWTAKKAGCDKQQDTMDAAACTILATSQDVCKTYSDCYTSATSSYNNDKKSVESQEVAIKNEWKALLHLQCLLNVFSKSDSEKATAMATCNNMNYDSQATSTLKLTYPSPVPRTAKTCSEAADEVVAGRDSYKAKYYNLPSNAPAKTCEAECCANCADFTCPSGYFLKDNAGSIWSELRDECCEPTFLPGSKLVTTKTWNDKLKGWVSGYTGTGTWHLCYRKSTRSGDDTWRRLCKSRSRLLSILKNSEGKVIGAFNSGTYGSEGYKNQEAFLFSLTTGYKHERYQHTQYSTYGHANHHGITHGGGHDLYIHPEERRATSSYCNLGYTYRCRVGSYGSSTCRNDFCGKYNGFEIEELETYYYR